MKIEPLSKELIAKLEIAVAHRNRERAVAVIERHFEELDKPTPKGLNTPLADILPMRQASVLARAGFVEVSDLEGVTEIEILSIRNAGKQLLSSLRSAIKQHAKIKDN